MNLFETQPHPAVNEAVAALARSPGALGAGWRFLGGDPSSLLPATLLFGTPAGETVLFLAAERIDSALLALGLKALGQARLAAPLLASLLSPGRPAGPARLLLVGATVTPEALLATGPEVEVRLLAVVLGQPGPPALLCRLPLTVEPGAPAPESRPAPPGMATPCAPAPPAAAPGSLTDGEVEALLGREGGAEPLDPAGLGGQNGRAGTGTQPRPGSPGRD